VGLFSQLSFHPVLELFCRIMLGTYFGRCLIYTILACWGRIICESRLHNSKSIQSQSLTFAPFESEEIKRETQRFSFKLELRPWLFQELWQWLWQLEKLAACFNLIKIANVSLWFPQFNLKAGVKRFRATLNQESWILAAHRIQPQLLWRRHLTDNCQRVYVYEPRALLETFGFWHESSVFWHWSLWVSNRRLQALGFRLRFKCFGLSFKLMVLGCRVQTWGEFQRPLHPPRTT